MEKVKKYLNVALPVALIASCWGEFILCFARGYEELWYTILIPSAIVTALALSAFRTRHKWLYFLASAIVSGGAVLLIGFPDYVTYLALVLGGLSVLAEIFWLVLYLAGGEARSRRG